MKAGPLKWTHAVAAVAAFAIVLTASRQQPSKSAAVISEHPALKTSRTEHSAGGAGRRARPVIVAGKGKAFQGAWDRIATRRLPRSERIQLQIELLKGWAEVDLEGAIAAALTEPWDEGFEKLLFSAFGDILAARPDEIWRMIRSGQFGIMGSALVRDAWVEAISTKNPDLIFNYLPEMDGIVFRKTLGQLVGQVGDAEQANHLWDELAKKANWSGEARAYLGTVGEKFANYLTLDELRKKLTAADESLTGLACSALAAKLRMEGGNIRAEIDKVPENLRSQLAFDLLKASSPNKNTVRAGISHLLDHEEWGLLRQRETLEQVRWLGTVSDPVKLADWAANLPPRAETADIFHEGIRPYMAQNPEAAWTWINQFEPGLWKDRAYAHFAIQTLKAGDEPRAQQVVALIQDPQVRVLAERWQSNWKTEQSVQGGVTKVPSDQ